MQNIKSQHHFYTAILLAVIALTVLLFLPYLTALVLALVFALTFHPPDY